MAVVFINANQAAVTTGVTTITLTKPTNTVDGDVMITSFGIRPNTATITTLAGWTLIRSTANANATANKQASYYKVASGEGASYAWTLGTSPAGCCGGILTFRGVAGNSVATSINIENSLADAVGATTHLTPDVTTTVRDTMVVTAHVCANNDTWTAPAAIGGDKAMDERVDVANATSPMCLGMFTCEHTLASATGQKAATDAGPDAVDVGTSHIMTLMPILPTTCIRDGRTTSRMLGAPAQRFAFRQPYLPFPGASPGAAAFELPGGAAAGSYILTGQAATLLADRVINAVAGTYTLTGSLAGIVAGRALDGGAVAGTYTLTGQPATLLADRMLNAVAGVYLLTGSAATLAADKIMSLDAGVYVLTGFDVTMTRERIMSADAGSYTLVGLATTLLADRLLSGNAGAYTLTGAPATLAANRLLVADFGAYVLTGAPATLIADRLLSANAGAYVLTGVDATLEFTPIFGTFVLNADPGVYTLIGFDVTLEAPAAVTPKPMGFYGVSFRREKRKYEGPLTQKYAEESIGDFIRAFVNKAEGGETEIQVVASLVTEEDAEVVNIQMAGIPKEYIEVIIVAILASEV